MACPECNRQLHAAWGLGNILYLAYKLYRYKFVYRVDLRSRKNIIYVSSTK